MAITTAVAYQQALSLAIEQRSSQLQDLVSNNNALLAAMNARGLWEAYSGPRIRQTLQIDKSSLQWFSGYDTLANSPIELFNDAYFTPKFAVVPVSLPMDEIWNNQGRNQLKNVLKQYMLAAENALMDGMDTSMYSDGTANGGKEIGGLGVAVPIVATTGTYGGIDRAANPVWRTTTYDANSAFSGITQINATTIRPILTDVMSRHTRGTRSIDLWLMDSNTYQAYDAATVTIQRITNESTLAKLGFTTLAYAGAGRRADIVLAGGLGSAMPANTIFGLETDSFRMRYNPGFNFDKLFDGEGQMPINQAAVSQFIGWGGELTQVNPRFNVRIYDSVP